jgi:hypothetical protein
VLLLLLLLVSLVPLDKLPSSTVAKNVLVSSFLASLGEIGRTNLFTTLSIDFTGDSGDEQEEQELADNIYFFAFLLLYL